MSLRLCGSIAILHLFVLGCGLVKDTAPDGVRMDPPPPRIIGREGVRLSARVVNKSGESLVDLPVAFTSTPDTVAEVSPSGLVKCKRTGEVTVRAAYGEFAEEGTIGCRIVESIRGPGRVTTVVGESERLSLAAISDLGGPLDDVPVKVVVADDAVARWADGAVTGVQAGTTELRLTAGDVQGTVEVAVYARLSVSVRLDAQKGTGDAWDSAFSGSNAPDPYVRVDGKSLMLTGGESECADQYRCESTLLTLRPDDALEVEVWDRDFSDDDYAGVVKCSRGRECPTGQGAVVEVR